MAILGADFLSHHGLLLDLKNRRLLDSNTSVFATCFIGPTAQVHSISAIAAWTVPDGPFSADYNQLLNDVYKDEAEPAGVHTTSSSRRRATRGSKEGVRRPLATRNYQAIFKPVGKPDPPRAQTRRKMASDRRLSPLNARTRPDRHPLPIIEDLLQEINGRVFSVVDLRRAFYQIPVAEEDIPKTAVTTPFGLFEFVGMPLGLRNSAQSFQRAMNHLLRNLDYVKCYQDDILVLSSNHEEHLRHLRGLFDVLQRAKLHVNWDKCQIGRTHVIFAGYEISPDGFKPPEPKSQAILDFPRPEDSTQLRRFIGMVNYYRRCLPHAAELMAPLSELLRGLTKKKEKLKWTPEAERAFTATKNGIATAVCSAFLFPDQPLSLHTDASNTAIVRRTDRVHTGARNVVADALSRVEVITMPTAITSARISAEQDKDDQLPHLLLKPRVKCHRLTIDGHPLVYVEGQGDMKPYLPVSLRREAFDAAHHLSHPSGRATAKRVALQYFWPSLRKDVGRWAKQCIPCQLSKVHRHNRAELGKFTTPDGRFDHIHLGHSEDADVSGVPELSHDHRSIHALATSDPTGRHRCTNCCQGSFRGLDLSVRHTFDHHHRPGRSIRVEASRGARRHGRCKARPHDPISSKRKWNGRTHASYAQGRAQMLTTDAVDPRTARRSSRPSDDVQGGPSSIAIRDAFRHFAKLLDYQMTFCTSAMVVEVGVFFSKPICASCGEPAHTEGVECQVASPTCINCKGPHKPTNKNCIVFKKNQQLAPAPGLSIYLISIWYNVSRTFKCKRLLVLYAINLIINKFILCQPQPLCVPSYLLFTSKSGHNNGAPARVNRTTDPNRKAKKEAEAKGNKDLVSELNSQLIEAGANIKTLDKLNIEQNFRDYRGQKSSSLNSTIEEESDQGNNTTYVDVEEISGTPIAQSTPHPTTTVIKPGILNFKLQDKEAALEPKVVQAFIDQLDEDELEAAKITAEVLYESLLNNTVAKNEEPGFIENLYDRFKIFVKNPLQLLNPAVTETEEHTPKKDKTQQQHLSEEETPEEDKDKERQHPQGGNMGTEDDKDKTLKKEEQSRAAFNATMGESQSTLFKNLLSGIATFNGKSKRNTTRFIKDLKLAKLSISSAQEAEFVRRLKPKFVGPKTDNIDLTDYNTIDALCDFLQDVWV
ncbi:unnamed protein product [Trichogramma brassicae]|uniref:RNA-directed DNA polymerase n=1 Tax=Trichogramma brassicae TaxID=86971 RepID=A0A6H5IZX4_9HYME|nr:unnamed protein product [Trichogramma brassicae]